MNLEYWRLLPVSTVARWLGCSPGNVYKLLERGELVCIRTGASKGYKITESELAAFMERRQAALEALK